MLRVVVEVAGWVTYLAFAGACVFAVAQAVGEVIVPVAIIGAIIVVGVLGWKHGSVYQPNSFRGGRRNE